METKETKEGRGLRRYSMQPFALPIDWLDLSLSVPGVPRDGRPWGNDDVVTLGPRLALVRQPGRSRVFDRLDMLTDTATDKPLALVRSCPHSTEIIGGDRLSVKLDNESLYTYTWSETLRQLLDIHGWRYHATTRLDLAADGHNFLLPFHDAARGAVAYGGRADFVTRYSDGQLKAAELGTRSANKFGRIYKKSRELALSGKNYIRDYWQHQGGTDLDNVERCEVQVKGRELRRYTKDEACREFLDKLTEPKYRATLFHSVADTFIRFRSGQCGDRSRDREDLLAWDFTRLSGEPTQPWPRERRLNDFGVNTLKSHIRLTYMMHVATGSRRYLATAQEVAEASNLATWYRGKTELWKRQAEKLAGEGLRAANLFDLLQGCDETDLEQARAELERKKQKRREDLRAARDMKAEAVRRAKVVRGIGGRTG